MRNAYPRKLQVYRDPDGREPFSIWFQSIRDTRVQDRIQARLDLVELGSLGDYGSVGDSVFELRLHFGPGYRIYFGQVDNTVILLLSGGDKSSQRRDIARAKTYWSQYKETHR